MLQYSDKFELTIPGEEVTKVISDILIAIDRICEKEKIEYFAFSEFLSHIVHYHELLDYDGKMRFDIGLLRPDYDRFMSVVERYIEGTDVMIDIHPDYDIRKKYRSSVFRLSKIATIERDGMKVTEKFSVDISPFDKIPEFEDTRRSFYRQMKRANKKLTNISRNRWFIEGRVFRLEKGGEKPRRFIWNTIRSFRKNSKKVYDKLQKEAQSYNKSNSSMFQRVTGSRTQIITREQLYPIRRERFGDITVPLPNDYSMWTRVFAGEEQKQIKEIQQVDLELLAEMDRVCEKIGVGYFVCGGTMLGYVRHGGFIPWDDDVDCGMLRADYNRFLAEADKYLNHERFFLQTRESDPTIPYLFSKIRVNDTDYITEYNKNRPYHKGICLDIFPFDVIPDGELQQQEWMTQAKRLARQHHFIANRQKGDPPEEERPVTKRDKWNRFISNAHRKLFRSIPLTITQRKYDRFVTQLNDRANDGPDVMVGSFVPTYTFCRIDTLLPFKKVDFEGVMVNVPNKPEVFLKMQYGDYMTPPPPHQQIGHELIEWLEGEKAEEKPHEG